MKLYWNGKEKEAELPADGFIWELWKDEGRSMGYNLAKAFPDGNRQVVSKGILTDVVYDYDAFLAEAVKNHTEKNG